MPFADAKQDDTLRSWGLQPLPAPQTPVSIRSRHATLPRSPDKTMLPRGLGRSYGDVCLNGDGLLLMTDPLDRWISFDPLTGILQCEAGVSLDAILKLAVPRGWFPSVTPGTRFVSVGGAIANDVHGKNHHRAGTFGAHVRGFELLRSDGARQWCSRTSHADRFRATIGGLGLTGLITWAELQLQPIHNPMMDTEDLRMDGLSAFFDLADESDAHWDYTVAWVDGLASGEKLGSGIFMRGNHARPDDATPTTKKLRKPVEVPLHAPDFALNRHSIRLLNFMQDLKLRGDRQQKQIHFAPFFYPLDGVGGWNKLYGRRGFFQYQFVVPRSGQQSPVRDILRTLSESDESVFLAVLKCFGDAPPEGLLSFPRPGVTLALDFPNRGDSTLNLMKELDEIVFSNGGALYPAKDARMSPDHFRRGFPALDLFQTHIDPAFSSDFARRVEAIPPRNPS
ncbi:MAG: FAD-binding oxidoreductase [Verrucomicrobia bacterium]|nr:FAD-binding oxidoreductase [Verrucomicrobiota bacterium]MCH8513984.1 FAD-binding oxidoreductase [Kiritimatiellia bacterium]